MLSLTLEIIKTQKKKQGFLLSLKNTFFEQATFLRLKIRVFFNFVLSEINYL